MFPLLFSDGLGIYLTTFPLFMPLLPPCKRHPVSRAIFHRVERCQEGSLQDGRNGATENRVEESPGMGEHVDGGQALSLRAVGF